MKEYRGCYNKIKVASFLIVSFIWLIRSCGKNLYTKGLRQRTLLYFSVDHRYGTKSYFVAENESNSSLWFVYDDEKSLDQIAISFGMLSFVIPRFFFRVDEDQLMCNADDRWSLHVAIRIAPKNCTISKAKQKAMPRFWKTLREYCFTKQTFIFLWELLWCH
jgi:hypothetical protein